MSSILLPDASVSGLPHGASSRAPRGFTLGEHVNDEDALDGKNGGYHPHGVPKETPFGRHFSPYQNNGGTVLAVSGKDYTVVASDTRHGQGYSVPARYVSRVMKLNDKVVIASSGMQSHIATLFKVLKIRNVQYKHHHNKEMSLTAASQMLSTILYYRRFQPYYTFNVLGGIDENGTSDHIPHNSKSSSSLINFRDDLFTCIVRT